MSTPPLLQPLPAGLTGSVGVPTRAPSVDMFESGLRAILSTKSFSFNIPPVGPSAAKHGEYKTKIWERCDQIRAAITKVLTDNGFESSVCPEPPDFKTVVQLVASIGREDYLSVARWANRERGKTAFEVAQERRQGELEEQRRRDAEIHRLEGQLGVLCARLGELEATFGTATRALNLVVQLAPGLTIDTLCTALASSGSSASSASSIDLVKQFIPEVHSGEEAEELEDWEEAFDPRADIAERILCRHTTFVAAQEKYSAVRDDIIKLTNNIHRLLAQGETVDHSAYPPDASTLIPVFVSK